MDAKVHIIKEKCPQKYLAEMIADEIWEWKGKKILISAPTGFGKTTFVVKVLMVYHRKRGKKLLILCNRRLLRMQYWKSILEQFESYAKIEECVKIMTYQELAEMIKNGVSLKRFFLPFETIVSDECHFFYSDSDFNGHGTYALLQEMINAGALKTLIFMSATMAEVKPLIEQTIEKCLWRLSMTERNTEISKENAEILLYDYMQYANYDRFNCIYIPDWESLCEILAESSRKTVIFINNKEKGNYLMEQLIKTGKVEKTQIAIFNADNIETNNEVVQALSIGNRLLPKILITTAVLDNGVSIHDPEVGNIIIETESRIEFLQMLGRIRSESTEECRLYFVQRDKNEFLKRMNRYKNEVYYFKNLKTKELRKNRNYYLQEIMSDGNMAEFYKKALVWMKFSSQFYVLPEDESYRYHLESDLYVNEFARHKIGDMYIAESRFYTLAISNPFRVIYEMMAWIGKQPEELQVMESEYRKEQEQEFIDRLRSVQKYKLEELGKFKQKLVKDYRGMFFSDILAKNGTIENGKLSIICERYGMKLVTEEETDGSRRKLYTIQFAQEEEDNV
ncbi:MAG: DEAD/DEAH box helicase family protein [Lachnospiraceae bacterium]|nr:DEAD/DEAH box helicase family protein [Lachnospiraceae bacterium]